MNVQMRVLSVGGGILEDGGNLWANCQILDTEQVIFQDDSRLDKGVKVAKVNLDTSNDNELVKRFFLEDFPADFVMTVSNSVKKGAMTMKIINFKSNIKAS